MRISFPHHLLPNTKERFNHVFFKLEALWLNSELLCQYVNELVTEEKRYDRDGFPEDVFRELFEFYKFIHEKHVCKQYFDPWYSSGNKII